MAFIQHIVYHLSDEGTLAVLMPHGVLFRGGAEGHIRQYLIKELNCLDAVIGLPANIFYSTGIPTCVLVFKKCRKNLDDILFIDASNDFEKVKTTNIIRPEDTAKIIDAYLTRKDIEKYAKVASIESIRANVYNLNIPRYVDTFEAEEQIDLDTIVTELKALDIAGIEADKTIASFCLELGIEPPFEVR
jgi:type I restriction enzyme M protein